MNSKYISFGLDPETYDYWLARDAWTASEVQFLMGGYRPVRGEDPPQHPDLFVVTEEVLDADGKSHLKAHVLADPASSHSYQELLEDAVSAGMLKPWSRTNITGSPRLYARDIEMRFDPAEVIAWVRTIGPRVCSLFPFRWELDRRILLRQGLFGRVLEKRLEMMLRDKIAAGSDAPTTAIDDPAGTVAADYTLASETDQQWQPRKPERTRGYIWPLYLILLEASRDGKPVPTVREVLDAFITAKPQEIANVTPDGIAYYTVNGDVKSADSNAIRKTIARLVKKD